MPGKSETGKISGRVRVTLPISVACDLWKFQRALANVAHCMRSGGHPPDGLAACLRPREFIVDPASLQVREVPEF